MQREQHRLAIGQRSRWCEFVVFSFRFFADIHRTRVGEKEDDGYDRDVYSRDRPKDDQQKQKEKCCDYRAARVGLDFFDRGCEALLELMYKSHFQNKSVTLSIIFY